ncbi:MAG: ATP-binding protein [Candidatus Methanoplasma sp.]|nr:ATP-binding protein [Candidatus Methanoplasma sp.]
MLRRKMSDILMKWKSDHRNDCLLVMGARQVGKTFIIDDFARKNYKNYVYMNFEIDPGLKSVFDGSLEVDNLITEISGRVRNAALEPGKTLIFLDEIQSCPQARTSLKSFALDGRFDVIASGSLLGLNRKKISSYPVGYETPLWMHSLDFEEFLWALGVGDRAIEKVKRNIGAKEPLSGSMLDAMNEYFRWHMLVGGMPQAVNAFIGSRDLGRVSAVQKKIVENYSGDISKYAPNNLQARARACLRSVPAQLNKRNKRFMLSQVDADEPRYTGALEDSIDWLYEAGIIDYCRNLCEPTLPLMANARTGIYKIYMRDTGLLISMMEDGVADAILNKDLTINQGAVMENIIAEIMIKKRTDLFYFEKRGSLEVDFITNIEGTAAAIEVKSGNNNRSKSLDSVMSERYNVKRGMKFENSNIFVDEKGIEHYPQFAAAFVLPDHSEFGRAARTVEIARPDPAWEAD